MPTTLNAIRGKQGSHTFFCANLEYGEIANLVQLPEEVVGDDLFDHEEAMQRKLHWQRVNGPMKDYILKNEDAFFSSLTLFIVPRDESPLQEGEGYEYKEFAQDGATAGILTLRSTVVLFPADGQHRAAAIKEALKESPQLAGQMIPVVLVPYKGKAIVRQMFSDLNLHAKPVSKTVGYAFETRDPVTLLAKDVAKTVSLFGDRVNYKSNSLPDSSVHVITLNTLRSCTEKICELALGMELKSVSRNLLVAREGEVVELWKLIIDSFSQWKSVLEKSDKASALRREFVFPHGIGWQGIVWAAAVIAADEQKAGREPEKKIRKALKSIDWKRSNPDFQNVAMAGGRVNNTGPSVRALAGYILWKAGYHGVQSAQPLINAFRKVAPGSLNLAKAAN